MYVTELVRSLLGMSSAQLRQAANTGRHLGSSLEYLKVLLLHALVAEEDRASSFSSSPAGSSAEPPAAAACASLASSPDSSSVSVNQVMQAAATRDGRHHSISAAVANGIAATNNAGIFEAGSSLHPVSHFLHSRGGPEPPPPSLSPHPLLPLALYPLPSPLSLFLRPPPPLLPPRRLLPLRPLYEEVRASYIHPSNHSQLPFCEATGLKRHCDGFNELSDNVRSLFCRRCYRYGCALHGGYPRRNYIMKKSSSADECLLFFVSLFRRPAALLPGETRPRAPLCERELLVAGL
jgi:hypothetical protein